MLSYDTIHPAPLRGHYSIATPTPFPNRTELVPDAYHQPCKPWRAGRLALPIYPSICRRVGHVSGRTPVHDSRAGLIPRVSGCRVVGDRKGRNTYLVVGKYQGVRNDHILPPRGCENNDLGNIIRCQGLTATVRGAISPGQAHERNTDNTHA